MRSRRCRKPQEVDNITNFHAFAVTNTFTALAITGLAERGRLDIDERVKEFLSLFPYTYEI